MDPQLEHTLSQVEEATTQLIEACHKNTPLYLRSPKAAAQVTRTGKWLLNALSTLRTVLENPSAE